jgi:hypothetical protein
MSIITKMRKQTAVYWGLNPATPYDNFGQPIFITPVEILCRWEDTVEEYIDPKGERRMSHSIADVDRVMNVNGRLKLCALVDLDSNLLDPYANDNTWEIHRFDTIPNLKNTENLLTAYM